MSYTNRKFNWDLDALKRFYNTYVYKWINSAMAWSNAQVARARANVGGTVDVSVLNAVQGTPATYESLTAALAAVPQVYQRGGMSIKFVQSSDNKYVQYRLMSDTFSTTVTDWQGVDENPTADSKNLVESGGVDLKKCDNKDVVFLDQLLEYGEAAYPTFIFTNNAVNNNTGHQSVESPLRASTPLLYYAPFGLLQFTISSGYYASLYKFDSNKNFLGRIYANGTITNDSFSFFRLLVTKSDNTQEITTSEAANAVNVKCVSKILNNVYNDIANNSLATSDLKKVVETNILDIYNLLNPASILADTAIVNDNIGDNIRTETNNLYKSVLNIPVRAGISYNIGDSHRIAIIYDSNGIIRQKQTVNQSEVYTITSEINGYLGISFYSTEETTWVGEADKIDQYIPYGYIPKAWLTNVIDSRMSDINSRISDLQDLVNDNIIEESPNLLNPANIQAGKGIRSYGTTLVLDDSPYYKTIIGIPVKANTQYNIGNSHRILAVYDSEGNVLQRQNTEQTNVYTLLVESNGFLAISFRNEEAALWVGEASKLNHYEPYGENIAQTWLLSIIAKATRLTGKTIYNFGDSVSHGSGNIVDGVLMGGPAVLVAKECGMICNDFAVGGASICDNTPTRSWILNQIQNAPSTAPDFVLLAGGINDLKFTTPGNAPSTYNTAAFDEAYINSLDVSVVSGGLEKAIYTILNKWPSTQLIYMWEHKMWGHYDATHIQLHDVIIDVCKKWNIPVLDMYEEGGLNLCVKSQVKLYGSTTSGTPTVTIDGVQYDGTHCNGLGYDVFYVPKLRALLESLLS